MLVGRHPFDDPFRPKSIDKLKALACTGRFEVPSSLTRQSAEFIKCLLSQKPSSRPKAHALAKSSWCGTFYATDHAQMRQEEVAASDAAVAKAVELGLDGNVLLESIERGAKNYLTAAHFLLVENP